MATLKRQKADGTWEFVEMVGGDVSAKLDINNEGISNNGVAIASVKADTTAILNKPSGNVKFEDYFSQINKIDFLKTTAIGTTLLELTGEGAIFGFNCAIGKFDVYVDNVLKYQISGQSVTLIPGFCVVVKDLIYSSQQQKFVFPHASASRYLAFTEYDGNTIDVYYGKTPQSISLPSKRVLSIISEPITFKTNFKIVLTGVGSYDGSLGYIGGLK